MNIARTILCLAGWAGLLAAAEQPRFSHRRHLEEGADCATCHQMQSPDRQPRLQEEACTDCHQQRPAGWQLERGRPLRADFSHRTHAGAVECLQCHRAVAEDAARAGQPRLDADACFNCHRDSGVALQESRCLVCHGRDERKFRPPSHQGAWRRRHGLQADAGESRNHPQSCTLCHQTASSCTICHLRERPSSHNALWLRRGHGLAADFERERCRLCHDPSACIQCHRRSPPLNHRGAWNAVHGLAAESRSDRHCSVCHSLGWCAACHNRSGP